MDELLSELREFIRFLVVESGFVVLHSIRSRALHAGLLDLVAIGVDGPFLPDDMTVLRSCTSILNKSASAGAISQALKYRSSLMENIQNLQRGEPAVIASEPYCVVVAGDCAELNSSEKKASFERFRERLNGVRILTFDEVYKRIEGLLAIFTDSSGVSPQKS
jgi:hypothetical protein